MVDEDYGEGYEAGYRRGESERVKLSSKIAELQAKIGSMQELINVLNKEIDQLVFDNKIINGLLDDVLRADN